MKVITIGRNYDNNIVVNDGKVSRVHLQIVQDDNGNVSVVDLNSANGTLVNGKRITGETRLHANDVVQIGNTTLPWQSYFTPAQQPVEAHQGQIRDTQQPQQLPLKPKRKRKIWWIAAAIALVLLAGGGVYWKISHDKKVKTEQEAKEKAEAEEKEKNDAIEKFYQLRLKIQNIINITVKIDEDVKNTIQKSLEQMKEIADKYPDETALQNAISELQKSKDEWEKAISAQKPATKSKNKSKSK